MDAYFSTSDLIPSIHTTEEAFYFFFNFFFIFTHDTQVFLAFWLPRISCTFINIQEHSDIFTLNINLSFAGSDSKTVRFIYRFIQRMQMLKITAWENPMFQGNICLLHQHPVSSSPRHQLFSPSLFYCSLALSSPKYNRLRLFRYEYVFLTACGSVGLSGHAAWNLHQHFSIINLRSSTKPEVTFWLFTVQTKV